VARRRIDVNWRGGGGEVWGAPYRGTSSTPASPQIYYYYYVLVLLLLRHGQDLKEISD